MEKLLRFADFHRLTAISPSRRPAGDATGFCLWTKSEVLVTVLKGVSRNGQLGYPFPGFVQLSLILVL